MLKGKKLLFVLTMMTGFCLLAGCGKNNKDGKTVIELVQYKPEATSYFEEVEERFNASHDDIELKISSPNDAMTVLKTRFVREDNPDIIGIGGDINYSNFIDADMLMDISDFDGLADIKENYLTICENLKFIPTEGTYSVPYVANAAGILYNRDMFEEHGWKIPETWDLPQQQDTRPFGAYCRVLPAYRLHLPQQQFFSRQHPLPNYSSLCGCISVSKYRSLECLTTLI